MGKVNIDEIKARGYDPRRCNANGYCLAIVYTDERDALVRVVKAVIAVRQDECHNKSVDQDRLYAELNAALFNIEGGE